MKKDPIEKKSVHQQTQTMWLFPRFGGLNPEVASSSTQDVLPVALLHLHPGVMNRMVTAAGTRTVELRNGVLCSEFQLSEAHTFTFSAFSMNDCNASLTLTLFHQSMLYLPDQGSGMFERAKYIQVDGAKCCWSVWTTILRNIPPTLLRGATVVMHLSN